MDSIQEFCSVETNTDSIVCKAYDFVGPIPPGYEIILFMFVVGILVTIFLLFLSPTFLFRKR